MSKISLGTAQFGLDYGVKNVDGKVKFLEVKKIIKLAHKNNIDLIDTAVSYGVSEKVIGETGISDFKFVTKLPDPPKDCIDIEKWVISNIYKSISLLGIDSLYGVLIHNSSNFMESTGKKIINSLKLLKSEGLLNKIGISIYDPSECEKILKLTRVDIVQAPLNIIDRRLVSSGLLSKLRSEKIEIHTRSVFLQGLLLMPVKNIPKYFYKWPKLWSQWALELKKNNLDPLEACLSYPLSIPEIDHVIVGVESAHQLNEVIQKSKKKLPNIDWSFMVSNNQNLINPTNWQKI